MFVTEDVYFVELGKVILGSPYFLHYVSEIMVQEVVEKVKELRR